MALVYLYWTTLALNWAWVEWAGGMDERLCVRAVLVCSLLTKLVMRPMSDRFDGFEWRVMTIDLLLLATLVFIVVRSTRYWPVWATGFQVADICTHLAAMSGVSRRAYALALGVWAYAVLASAVIGTRRRQQ